MTASIYNAPNAPQVLAVLYCGLSCPNGDKIQPGEFDEFLSESVTPRYPGFTIQHAEGYWKGAREYMASIHILMDDDSNARHGIRQIAEHYKTRFGQEAVGVAFFPCSYSMFTWPDGPVAAYHKPGKGY